MSEAEAVLEDVIRKQADRVRLVNALRATVGGTRAYILEASVTGFLVAHQAPVPARGEMCDVVTEWDGQPMSFRCGVEATEERGTGERGTIFHSLLHVTRADTNSCSALRSCVEWHVMRALEEQKANARGVPVAGAAWSDQTGGGTEYVRHEFVCNRWTMSRTRRATQPPSGFTVSVHCSVGEFMMLREAYERADTGLRNVIRELAQASIEQVNGIPTRRFVP